MQRFDEKLLQTGRVYRTAEFLAWASNPARLVEALERRGVLRRLAHGLYMRSDRTKFGGLRRADDEDLLTAFLGDDNFVITGSEAWNALGLGAKAVLAVPFVYNRQRSGEASIDGRRFVFKRCKFPRQPTAEWYVVDLLEHHATAQLSLTDAASALVSALQQGRFNAPLLARIAVDYGSAETLKLIMSAFSKAGMLQVVGWGCDPESQGEETKTAVGAP